MTRSRRAGFTLIELLVVIAIIAILAAILFPVFARARAKARQAACSSNMKQVALALISYTADYDGQLPYFGQDGVPDYPTWDEACLPYMKNTQILICPDNKYNKDNNDDGEGSAPKRGYALPRYVAGANQDDPPNPSATVLLVEKGAYTPGNLKDAAAEHPLQAGKSQEYPTIPFRHNDGLNFAFVDGHVKWQNSGSGPFTNDGQDPTACLARANSGAPGLTWTSGHIKGHMTWPEDWPAGAD